MQVHHQGVQTGLEQQRDTGVHVDESLPYPMSTAKSLSAIDAALIAKGHQVCPATTPTGLVHPISRNCGLFRLRSFRTAQAKLVQTERNILTLALCFPGSKAWDVTS